MNRNSNIYGVPEGYFGRLQSRLEAIPAQQSQPAKVVSPVWSKVRPYIALAACFIITVCFGNFVLNKSLRPVDDCISFEDICYADLIPVTNPYIIYDDAPYTYDVQEATDDDVVEYLISSGASIDYISYLLNE